MNRSVNSCIVMLIAALCLVAGTACDQEGGGPGDATIETPDDPGSEVVADVTPDAEPDAEPDASCTASVSGTVGREVATCPPLYGGIGPLCVHVLSDCTDLGTQVASVTVPDANLSYPTNTVNYTVTDVPPGSWQLRAYHDDDESGCDGVLTSGDFSSGDVCIPVTVDESCTDVTGANVTFNVKTP